jgi:hypothetical protein
LRDTFANRGKTIKSGRKWGKKKIKKRKWHPAGMRASERRLSFLKLLGCSVLSKLMQHSRGYSGIHLHSAPYEKQLLKPVWALPVSGFTGSDLPGRQNSDRARHGAERGENKVFVGTVRKKALEEKISRFQARLGTLAKGRGANHPLLLNSLIRLKARLLIRVASGMCTNLQTKNNIFAILWWALERKMLVNILLNLEYFMIIWYILWPFGIFLPFWYAVPRKIWQPFLLSI